MSELDKRKKSLSGQTAGIRGWIQAAATLLTNIHIPNFFRGKIYQGNAKTVCVPGLNCYSCPAATGACPIGAFQAVIGSSRFKFSYYVTGFFILLGVTLGIFHSQTEAAKISEIYDSYRFRYPSAAARNELYRNGRPFLL